jgi:hypothetical protein
MVKAIISTLSFRGVWYRLLSVHCHLGVYGIGYYLGINHKRVRGLLPYGCYKWFVWRTILFTRVENPREVHFSFDSK